MPGSHLCAAAVYCPFSAGAELMAETSEAKREAEGLDNAPVYTAAFHGRYVSLIGPASSPDGAWISPSWPRTAETGPGGGPRAMSLDLDQAFALAAELDAAFITAPPLTGDP